MLTTVPAHTGCLVNSCVVAAASDGLIQLMFLSMFSLDYKPLNAETIIPISCLPTSCPHVDQTTCKCAADNYPLCVPQMILWIILGKTGKGSHIKIKGKSFCIVFLSFYCSLILNELLNSSALQFSQPENG